MAERAHRPGRARAPRRAAASTRAAAAHPASRHSSVASVIGTSGSASRPSVPASGSSSARMPGAPARVAGSRSAVRDAHHQPRHAAAISRNGTRKASACWPPSVDAQPRQPRRQPRQVGIRPGQVLAFLPVEGLVDEQRQARGDHQLQREQQQPQARRTTTRPDDCTLDDCRLGQARPGQPPPRPFRVRRRFPHRSHAIATLGACPRHRPAPC